MSMLLKALRGFVPLPMKEFLHSLKERKTAVVELEEFKLALHQRDWVISESLRQSKVWAEAETQLFRELITPGMVVVDVGANIGYFTLLASRLVGSGGHVHAFEPDPVNCGLLRKNVRINHASNINVVQAALSDSDEPLHLFLNADNKGDHRIWEAAGETREKITVKATSLDSYLATMAAVPSFIKIDVQGAEGQVLAGMKKTLAQKTLAYLLLEFWPEALRKCQTDPKRIIEQIADAGFKIRVIPDNQLLGTNVIIDELFSAANADSLIELTETAPHGQVDLICARE